MTPLLKTTSCALLALSSLLAAGGSLALDLDKAHQTAIRNCVNWNGASNDYCTCVQDRVRAGLANDSYRAMLEFAQAYEENRRADLAAMQVDAKLAKALEPVDDAVIAAENACKS